MDHTLFGVLLLLVGDYSLMNFMAYNTTTVPPGRNVTVKH